MKYIAVLLFTMMSLLSVGQVRTYVIEASDTLSTNNVLRINGDIFNSTTKVSVNDTTLVSLQYLASVLASTEGVDSLSFNPVTGYLSYHSGGAVVDSLLFDGRYLTTEIDGSITNELQSLSLITSGTDRTINIAGGTGVTFSVADNDNSSTNEIQDLSGSGANLSGYTISLSGDATTVTLPNEADPVYAIDSAFIVRFSDIDTLGFLRTETDPVYSSDSSNIVWFSDLDIIRSTVIEASDSLITRGVLQVGADKFKATTQVSSDDTTLVSLDYLTGLLDNAEYADSLAFHSGTGYLVYYREGVALDSTSLDGRYLTAEVDGSVTNELQNLSLGTVTTTTQPLNISGGTGVTLPAATTTTAGLITSSDKLKLDNIEANANNYNHPTGFTDQPTTALTGASVISQIDVTSEGHVQGVSTRALSASDIGAEATQTKGNLTESVTGLQFSATRQVIGGAADLSLSAGYEIPTTTSISNWNTAYGWGNHATVGYYNSSNFISGTHYQAPITNPVTYSASSTNYLPKWTGLGTLGNSNIVDDGIIQNYAPMRIYAGEFTATPPNIGTNLSGLHLYSPTNGAYNGITFSRAGVLTAQAGVYVKNDDSQGTTMHLATTNNYGTGSISRLVILPWGDVGIGTTSPQSKLHINANQSGFASYIHNNVNTPGYNGLQISAWDGSVNTKYLEIIQQGNPLLLVNGFGNVGIGTTTPTAKLDVNGNIQANQLISTVATGTAPLSVASNTVVANLNSELFNGLQKSNVVYGNTLNGYQSNVGNNANDYSRAAFNTIFNVTNAPFAGDGGLLNVPAWNGQTSSSRYNLQIAGALNSPSNLWYRATDINGAGTWYKILNEANFIAGTHYQAPITNPTTGTGTTNYVTKWTGLTTQGNSQIFDNGTNVGIGTASPTSPWSRTLQVYDFANTSLSLKTGVKEYHIMTDNSEALGFVDYDSGNYTRRMLISSTGNVGIGTTTPAQKLDVNGNIRVRGVGTNTTSTVLGLDVNGDLTTNVSITDRLLSATANTSFTFDITAYESASVSTNTNITITFSNIVSGRSGSIEVIYTGASVVTFTIPSGYALYVGSTLYNSGTGLSKTVLSKSTGNAVYNYYVSGTNIYIDGNQNYN